MKQTELEMKIALANLIIKATTTHEEKDLRRIIIEQSDLVEQLLERKNKHEQ